MKSQYNILLIAFCFFIFIPDIVKAATADEQASNDENTNIKIKVLNISIDEDWMIYQGWPYLSKESAIRVTILSNYPPDKITHLFVNIYDNQEFGWEGLTQAMNKYTMTPVDNVIINGNEISFSFYNMYWSDFFRIWIQTDTRTVIYSDYLLISDFLSDAGKDRINKFIEEETNSITEIPEDSGEFVYTGDYIYFKNFNEEISEVILYNVFGQKVKHYGKTEEILLSDLPKGVYILSVHSRQNHIRNFKFIR